MGDHDEKFRYHLRELRGLLSEHQRAVIRGGKMLTPGLQKAIVGLLIAVCSALTYWLQAISTRPTAPTPLPHPTHHAAPK